MKRRNWTVGIEILLSVMLAVMLVLIFCTNIMHYHYRINADIASEGILARLIWESGEWIPSTWCVAMETRIFDIANLAALFYGITSNMSLSVGLACSAMTCAIIGSGLYLMKALKMSRVQILIFLLLCIVIPNNFTILEVFYLFAAYYSPHIVVLFITLGIYARALDKGLSLKGAGVAIILEFMLGMQGVRGILVIAGPVFAVEVVRYIYKLYKKEERNKNDYYMLGWSFLLIIAGFVGGMFPFSRGQSMSRNIRKAPQKLIGEVIPDIVKGIGFEEARGGEIILLIIFCLIAAVMVGKILYKGFKKQNIAPAEWIYLVLFGSPVATAVILTFTTTESSARYFFVLVIAFAFSVTLIVGNKIKIVLPMVFLCIVAMYFNIQEIYKPIMGSIDLVKDSRYQVVSYLQEREYDMAYTDFENANTMGIMANEPLRVAAIDSSAKMNICKWMTSTEWYVPNVPFEAKTAYIVTESRMKDFESFMEVHEEDIWFETKIDGYSIYGSEYNFSTLE